jgi:CxxC motif-containing protein
MAKELTCIECPLGCALTVEADNGKALKVSGHKCPKGEQYAFSEVENPLRLLTAAVLCRGLELKMLPVRTKHPIPKAKIIPAMDEIKKLRVDRPVEAGEMLVKDFLGLGVSLIATRSAKSVDADYGLW